MDRLNSNGLPRHMLEWALANVRLVRKAREANACLLCRRRPVNEAGVCESCYATLNEAELRLAERWLSGRGP